jgi:acetyltransferase-like isoleucine patch superfamily enzyme
MVLEEGDGLHIIKSIHARVDRQELLKVFSVMREVWLRRNSFVFQGGFIPPEHLVLKAKSSSSDFLASLQKVPSSFGEGG